MPPRTLFEKIWDAHIVREAPGEPTLLYIDLHLVHEVTSPQAFDGLRLAGRPVRRPDLTIATMDHNTPTWPLSEPVTDPIAKEPSDKGEFTVYRSTSSTSLGALTVYYAVSGTATNGTDYVRLTGTVTIPAGALSAPIPVSPRDDSIRELTETVVVTIVDPCAGPVPCIYNIGSASSAVVYIYDND